MAQTDYILGLDYGEKRIGVAIAHTIARLPRPLITLPNTAEIIQAIQAIVTNEHVGLVVIGLPRSMDGGVQAQAKIVQDFAAKLAAQLTVPIDYTDETLTSVEAERILKARKHAQEVEKGEIDALSAALILERYFEERPTELAA
jgi:putative Holliday junction resolvase